SDPTHLAQNQYEMVIFYGGQEERRNGGSGRQGQQHAGADLAYGWWSLQQFRYRMASIEGSSVASLGRAVWPSSARDRRIAARSGEVSAFSSPPNHRVCLVRVSNNERYVRQHVGRTVEGGRVCCVVSHETIPSQMARTTQQNGRFCF